jgi:hypothetical protein
MGNRGGQFHKPDRSLGRRRWASRAWIACLLEWKGRHEEIWVDRHYTQLFFLDEATALAAGHRPCALCRRADYQRFSTLWAQAWRLGRPPKAVEMDDVLHAERWASRGDSEPVSLPAFALADGTMALHEGTAHLVHDGHLWRWSFDGYRRGPEIGATTVVPITPPSIMGLLAAGYRPMLHPSAC